jgi:hypothetical protein
MSEWKIVTGDEKLQQEIEELKTTFDKWFNSYWSDKCTKEQMLSENSPLQTAYYKMTKTLDEVKEKYPLYAKETCDFCNKYVDIWIESRIYSLDDSRVCICKDCIEKLQELFQQIK